MGILSDLTDWITAPISGLIGGGLKMAANAQENTYNKAAAVQQQQWTEQNQQQAEQYNAQQADIARQFSAGQQLQAEDYNANQAEINRQFQQQMSSTAYQRATADMKAAGINPMVAYQQGGASSPSGGMGSVGAVGGPSASIGSMMGSKANPVALLNGVVTSASEAARLKPTVDNIEALTSKTGADEAVSRAVPQKTYAEGRAADAQARLYEQAIKTEENRTANVAADTANKGREQAQTSGGFGLFNFNPAYWIGAARESANSAKSFNSMYNGGADAGGLPLQ